MSETIEITRTPDGHMRLPMGRANIQNDSDAERLLRIASRCVEDLGAHPLLTEAVIYIHKARDAVADFVEGHKP